MVNDAMVTTADVLEDNGVVHGIDKVLVPITAATRDILITLELDYFPNPTTDVVYLRGITQGDYQVFNVNGKMVTAGVINNNNIRLDNIVSGTYILRVLNETTVNQANLSSYRKL